MVCTWFSYNAHLVNHQPVVDDRLLFVSALHMSLDSQLDVRVQPACFVGQLFSLTPVAHIHMSKPTNPANLHHLPM